MGTPRTYARALATGAVGCLLAALGISVLPPAVAAPQDLTFVRTIGGPGHAGVYPWGAATAVDGSILIGDYWNRYVRRYDPDTGALLQTFSGPGTGPGQSGAPHGMAVDPTDGSIYVSDLNNGEIDKFAADGTFLFSLAPFVPGVTSPYPYIPRVAVNSVGEVFIVSSHDTPPSFLHRVLVYSPTGTYLRSFGVNGTGDGQLNVIRGIAIGPGDDVYLADAGNRRIQVWTKDGTWLRTFGQGRFGGDMRGLAVANGQLYVSDSSNAQVDRFSLNGTYLGSFGSVGTGPGQMIDGGRELTVGLDGRVYVPDFGGYRVHVFSATGQFQFSFPSPAPGPPDGGFNQPFDVAVDSQRGSVYVADTFNHRVQKFTTGGAFVSTWGARGDQANFGMNYPRGVAVDPVNGNVWLNNTRQGNVKIYNQNGGFIRSFGSWGTGSGQLKYSRGLWVSNTRAWISDSGNTRVKAVSKTGAFQLERPCGISYNDLAHEGCTDMVQAADGTVYAAAPSDHLIYRWTSTGTPLGTFGAGILQGPVGVAIANNTLYVTELDADRVSAFSLDGTYLGSFGGPGSAHGRFRDPIGISADNAGNLYIADSGNERIEVFRAG